MLTKAPLKASPRKYNGRASTHSQSHMNDIHGSRESPFLSVTHSEGASSQIETTFAPASDSDPCNMNVSRTAIRETTVVFSDRKPRRD